MSGLGRIEGFGFRTHGALFNSFGLTVSGLVLLNKPQPEKRSPRARLDLEIVVLLVRRVKILTPVTS